MSQTTIPLEFERYLQNKISVGEAPEMNEMIFAYIPGLDPSQPIDRENGLCDMSLWVHQQDISQIGKLGDNSVAYSVLILGDVAEFKFNAIYLRDKNVPDSCGMVVYKPEETKEPGMAITKSLVQEYSGAANIAGITVDASTWQIDYQARLFGIEEDHRLACFDTYGHTAFLDGFDVTQQADPTKYLITPGLVYIGGLRTVLSGEILQTITTKPSGLYIDVVREGSALSKWENKPTIVLSETEKTDYIDEQNQQHYVTKLAGINADGSVTDWRVKGGLQEHINAENPHTQYLLKNKIQITENIKITVGETGDYSTINEAKAYLSSLTPIATMLGLESTIELQAGFVMREQVLIKGLNLGWVTITSVDAEVIIENAYLTTDFTTDDYGFESYPAFGVSKGGVSPCLAAVFTFDTVVVAGSKIGVIAVGAGSAADIFGGGGVKDSSGTGLLADLGATINAQNAIFSNAQFASIYANRGSTINAAGADASYAGTYGVLADGASTINFELGDATNAGVYGVLPFANSRISANNANTTGAGVYGCDVRTGSAVNAHGMTGTIGQSLNSLTLNGIIYQRGV